MRRYGRLYEFEDDDFEYELDDDDYISAVRETIWRCGEEYNVDAIVENEDIQNGKVTFYIEDYKVVVKFTGSNSWFFSYDVKIQGSFYKDYQVNDDPFPVCYCIELLFRDLHKDGFF